MTTATPAELLQPSRGRHRAFYAVLTVAVAAGASFTAASPLRADEASTEANITRLTTSLLEKSQLGHHPLDARLAGKIVERYVGALDANRSLFFQSDVDAFAKLGFTLAELTRAGDTTAAHTIYAVYLDRLKQQTDYVDRLLRASTFDFSGRDTYNFDRADAARPRDLSAARALWRQQLRAEYLQLKLGDKAPPLIVAALTRRHDQQLEAMKSMTSDEVLAGYLDAIAHVYDPHSDYLGHEQMDSLSIALNLSLVGIGATLESQDGYCVVRDVVPGGPAARSGLLHPGDRIVAVAQAEHDPVDIMNVSLARAVEMIRGQKGTTVTLSVLRAGVPDGAVPTVVSLVRDQIALADQEAKARIVDVPTKSGTVRIGVVDLPSFYADPRSGRSATTDVTRLLTKLEAEHVRGIVLDLRHNGGGSLVEAIDMTGLFIRRGPVVETRGATGEIQVGADEDPAIAYDGPLVVLTSRFSASASEIVAGALQDYGRALVVGDTTTFGKGTVQNILPLARIMQVSGMAHAYDPGELKISISKFYRPSGASTQLRGVHSDVVVPSLSDVAGVGEAMLPDPLPWDAIPAAPHAQLNRVQPYVADLRASSAARIATSSDFSYLAGEIARMKAMVTTKTVSLNEAMRRTELAQTKAHQLASVPIDTRTVYEITLKNASSPGLPAPGIKVTPRVQDPAEPQDDDIILREASNVLVDYVRHLSAP